MRNDIHIGGRTTAVVVILFVAAWLFEKSQTNSRESQSRVGLLSNYPEDKEGFPVSAFSDADPAMNAAIKEARKTLPDFIVALEENAPLREMFGVKTKVQDQFGGAHVWIVNVTFENDMFTGTLVNTPRFVRSVAVGQTLQVSRHKISDWSYVENGKLVGGYTMRVMLAELSEDERRELEEKCGYKMN